MEFDYLKHLSGDFDKRRIVGDLMDAYGRDVWNFAFSLVCKPELADDMMQEAFMRAFRNLGTFRGESTVKSWLLSITRNAVYDHLRSAYIRKVMLVGFIADRGVAPSAEAEAIRHWAANDVWAKVLALPVKLREVLVLTAHHQLSVEEIAGVLGVAEGTVKSRLHRARKRISSQAEKGERP
ncbi:sigma-70 family RNA polymerase sigma factor [Paenibacillus cymbidii]|uniref:sigma-70 family RNA polymerase sigma factor n=1 Tax=Paenibacillus cymbidii TaxID=1639034 RepID=UPI001F3E9EB4|nr:sigma-70 family RNA polymerase sigma factor [Paenibacillus cymbidii]